MTADQALEHNRTRTWASDPSDDHEAREALDAEVRRLRVENEELRAYNSRLTSQCAESLAERDGLRARVTRLEEYIGEHWNAFDADELRELMATDRPEVLVRAKPWTSAFPGAYELRSGDHADTTQDTTKTRCAQGESETSTSAADPAEPEATKDGQNRENS